MYFTHYSCVIMIIFNTGLYKSAFSAYSFGKLVFVVCRFLYFLPVLCQIRRDLCKRYNFCIITVFIVGINNSVFMFSLIKRIYKNNCRMIKIWLQLLQNSIYVKNVEHSQKERVKIKFVKKKKKEIEAFIWTFDTSSIVMSLRR